VVSLLLSYIIAFRSNLQASAGAIVSASQIQGAEGARTYQPSAQRWVRDCQKMKGWKPAPYTAIEIWFLMDRAFSPLIVLPSRTQRCALGWYVLAPLALESMDSLGEADFQIP
jgi:hypothetical protein